MAKGFQQPKLVPIDGFRIGGDECGAVVRIRLEFTDSRNQSIFQGAIPPEGLMALSSKIQHYFENMAIAGVNVASIRKDANVEPTRLEVMAGHIADALYLVCQENDVDMKDLFCKMLQNDYTRTPDQARQAMESVCDALLEAQAEEEGR